MTDHGYWPTLLGVVPWPTHVDRLIADDRMQNRPGDAIQRLAALAAMTPDDAVRVSKRLKLSRTEGDRLDAMARLGPELSPAIDDHGLRLLLYRSGEVNVTAALGIAAARRGGIGWHDVVRRLKALEVPVFPLRGQDLLARGRTPGPEVGAVLRQLESTWIDSGFKLSRSDLLARLA
jgi:poly(A) polymerase